MLTAASPEIIKQHLGTDFKPDHEYIVARHKSKTRLLATGWTMEGLIPDATTNEGGTMLVFSKPLPKPPPPPPKPKVEAKPPPKPRPQTTRPTGFGSIRKRKPR